MLYLSIPEESGQGLLEYALILSLVALIVFAALVVLGPEIGNLFSTINTCVPPEPSCPYYNG